MTILEFFNSSSVYHLAAYKVREETGEWPSGYLPNLISFPALWEYRLRTQIVDEYIRERLSRVSDDYITKTFGNGNVVSSTISIGEKALVDSDAKGQKGNTGLGGKVFSEEQLEDVIGKAFDEREKRRWRNHLEQYIDHGEKDECS